MRKSDSPDLGARLFARLRPFRFIGIAFVVLLAVAIGILQTSAAKNQAQQPTGPRTYQPTSIPITKFEPLNFAAAASAEQASAKDEDEDKEIEEADADGPGPKPQFASNVPINKATVDAARSAQAPLSFGTGISPGPSKTFKAEFISGTTIPPDTMGAVGTTHIVTVTNDRMRIQTRDGVEVSRLTVTSFWAGVTIKGNAASAFDTKVLFDRFNNRFFIESSGNGQNVNSGAMFAVSATADPTGAWYRWSVAADATSTAAGGHWIDFPSVGHNKNWFVIDENVFNFGTAGTAYWGQQVYVLDKQAAYNNTLGTINLFEDPFSNCVAPGDSTLGCGFTMAPAVTEDNTTDTVYMAEDWDSTAAQLRVSKVTGTPAAPLITVGTQFPQSANSWRFNALRLGTANNCGGTCSGGYAPQRQQSANLISGTRIQGNDSRIQNAVLRNGKLWTVHHVMLATAPQPAGVQIGGTGNPIDNHTAIQWWEIDPTNETAASTAPLQRGRIEDPNANNCHNGNGGTTAVAPCNGTTAVQFGTFLAFPSISVNQNEDVLIGFTQMSPFTYPAGAYAIRRAADTANTMRDIVVFRPGQSNYNIGSGSGTARQNRWGDYSAAQTDPLNDTDFWTVQEYAGTNRNDFLAPSYAGPWETWWGQVKPSDAQPSNSGGLIISEFRLRGPQGVRDEFVELYNPALVPLIVQTGDNSDGWALAYSSNGTTVSQVFAVIPNGTVIPPHGHFLVADNPDNTAGGTSALTYSLNTAAGTQVRGADSDTGWSLDLADNGGIALFSTATAANFVAGTRLDSAGFSSIAAGLFKEGNGIPAVTAATPTGQMTFYRDLSSGSPKDTGANENDFIFANTVVGETLGSNPRLGAAGPKNLDCPISLNGSTTLAAAVVDTGVGAGSGPNYVRDNTPVTNGAFGTLTLRRNFTNNTGATLTRLRFRVVNISGNPIGVSAADLRVLSAGSTSVSLSGGGTANIAASTIETPPTQSAGGGVNSTITIPAVAFASPLAAGSSMNLQFTLGVQTTGNFNFCLVPEGLGAPAVSAPLCFSGNTENTAPSITPATISRNGGDSSSSTIATVNDSQDGPGSLTVSATSIPTGITVTGITNTSGTITATVGADCSLVTGPYNVTLQVADSNGATTDGTLVVNVTATSVPPTPTISADTNGTGTQDQACPEQPLTLHANGAAGATSYQWYKDVNLLNGETNATYAATSAGTYYVTATGVCGTTPQSTGYVVQNPTPHSPFVSFRGQDSSVTTLAICQGSSQIIDADSPNGIHWWKDGVDLGPGSQSLTVTQAGVYTAQLNALGCHSQFGRNVTVTVNPLPPTPTITPGGPTTFCQGGSVTLTSSSATGNQWNLNGNPIGGATNNTYVATASGNYTVVVTDANSCASVPSAATSVTVNPLPPTPTITPGGPTTFCTGGSVTLTSSSATGNQWRLNGNSIGGATNNTYVATASGNYTVDVTDANSCVSAPSAATSVTVNPLPATPTITPGGPTTFCQGGSVTLTSSSATGNQWRLNGNPIGGATNNTYVATAGGNYTVVVTDANSCASAPSAATSVTVNPTPATPTITPGGPTTFCQGGSVTLTSSAATGNQWYLNGNPIGGATSQSYSATASGNYTVIDTLLGCPSAPSTATTVTVNPNPDATITTAAQECAGSTGNTASVANAGAGATYNWSITNGTITGGTGTANVTYTAGAAGTLTLQVTVTTAAGCSDTKSKNVTINAIPAKPTITPGGPTTFPSGGSVTLNSSSATGNQWYLNGNPIGGATNSSYVANAAGNYTVVVTTSGCSSPASDPTTVTTCTSAPVVTNGNDSGAGSLRQAIIDACDGATITFDMNQVVSPINLTTADLVINKNLTITGPGANLLTVQRSSAGGTPEFRIFTINPGKVVTISGLTVSNGKLTGGLGGGILNQNATLNLVNSAVTGNSVAVNSGLGGGICNQATANGTATMTITNSTISGNSAPGSGVGGGIGSFALSGNTATMTITNSTVSGNSADAGGGISSVGSGASVTITNVTISGNSATGSGGGGIAHGTGTPTTILRNTIVAGNTNGEINATVDPSSSFNLIGNNSPGGLTNGVNNNQVGVANALLAPLANYGGPTQTHALLPGSPAINAGSNPLATNVGLLLDQRSAGFNRIVNGTVDIGAFESRGFTIAPTSGSGQSTVFSTAFGSPLLATVSSAFAEPVVGGQVVFTAPGSGASATFTGGLTTLGVAIGAGGQSSVPATANAIVGGPYNVVASASGATSTNFALTNIKANQTIAVNTHAPSSAAFNSTFTVAATATSTLAVTYGSAGSCTNVGPTFTINSSTGACTVKYDQGGNGNFNSAPQVTETVNAQKANQTITFNALGNKNFGDADFPVSATASSTLAVTFTPSGNCSIATNQVHLTGAGSCTITAKQGGDSNFNAAADVPRAFNIAQAASTTAVSSSANPSNLTQSVTFTATVAGPAGTGTPTGTVTFKDGAATITCANAGGQTLNASGVATCQTSSLTGQSHNRRGLQRRYKLPDEHRDAFTEPVRQQFAAGQFQRGELQRH